MQFKMLLLKQTAVAMNCNPKKCKECPPGFVYALQLTQVSHLPNTVTQQCSLKITLLETAVRRLG